ncbi:Isopentenyl-diphosphate delta-isomerase [uncultured archaeon]|nr:Isopentenyl-diphosphate delta-isomerase [uncultured archaeon]
MSTISERKDAHLALAAKPDMQYGHSSGFDDVQFLHNSLPELNLKDIDCSTTFLNKKLSAPLMISGMTGGTEKGAALNHNLAVAAEQAGIALGLGSQRPMLKDAKTLAHYAVRELCPSIPLIGNIGAVNLREYPLEKIEWLVSSIEADALAIHLNPLQEAVQPEGDTDFSGVFHAIGKVCEKLPVPVIVKETGAGLNAPAAQSLFDAGVKFVECSGSGGTSWSKIEYARGGEKKGGAANARLPPSGFEEWGYPTIPSLCECVSIGPTICSGGVRSGMDAAKGLALGATLCGAAQPFFVSPDPAKLAAEWREQIRTAMFLTGSKDLEQFSRAPVFITGRSAELMRLRGLDPSFYAMSAPLESPSNGNERSHYL